MAKRTNKHGLKSTAGAPVCDRACDEKPETPPATESRTDGRQDGGKFAAGNSIGALTRFGAGNKAALQHGARAFEETGALSPELATRRESDIAGLVSDQGGPTEITTAVRMLMEEAGNVATIARLLLPQNGPCTERGKVRARTTAYLAAVDRLHRLLVTLGLERRARKTETLEDWLRKRAEAVSEAASTSARAEAAGDAERPSTGNVAVDPAGSASMSGEVGE